MPGTMKVIVNPVAEFTHRNGNDGHCDYLMPKFGMCHHHVGSFYNTFILLYNQHIFFHSTNYRRFASAENHSSNYMPYQIFIGKKNTHQPQQQQQQQAMCVCFHCSNLFDRESTEINFFFFEKNRSTAMTL